MAATLDADQEALTFFSFPIEKQEDTDSINPVDGTPDIWIVGKATDGTVDADRQIVDPEWSAVALKEWAATNANVRMAHDPKRPVGKGKDVQVTTDGHYVKSLICDPLAKHFIRTGVLGDYSVGISMPHIKFGPHKTLDPRGEATGGIITGRPDGLSKIAELSVVDRGSNFHSKFQITRKSAGGGDDFGFTGAMVGSQEEITKAAPPGLLAKVTGNGLLTKDAAPAWDFEGIQRGSMTDLGTYAQGDLSITFTPADMARLVQAKFVEKHYDELARQAAVEKRDFDPNVGGGVDRDKLPAEDFAGKDRSFPIKTQADVSDALQSIGRAGDDNYDAATLRSNIIRIARRKGFSVPGDSDGKNKGAEGVTEPSAEVAQKADAPAGTEAAATPDVIKKPDAKDAPVKKASRKPKGKKKLPPWLNKPSGDADDGKDDDASKACKSVTDHLWAGVEGTSDIVCSKCHTTPAQAAGVTASPMDPAPVGDLQQSNPPASVKGATPQSASGAKDAAAMSPVPAHREPDGAEVEAFEADAGLSDGDSEAPTRLEAPTLKASPEVLALLRFRHIGIDPELGKLHDLTCPAYHPDDVAKYHPFAELGTLIDEGAWARKALDAACGPIENALRMHELHQAALALKGASEADVNDWRLAAYKAFRDANPGPATYPSPGSVSPQKYKRPLITDGHAATSAGYSGPNTSPVIATTAPNATSFDRPPLSSGQQSQSPSFMKWDSGQYPQQQGVPTQLSYAHLEKDKQRMALVQMHDHLSRQFPEVCPLDTVDLSGRTDRPLRGVQPDNHPVPATAGIGKGAEPSPERVLAEAVHNGQISIGKARETLTAPVAAFKAEPETGADLFADADVYKGFKKMRKKLGKRVLSGKMTVDEARAKMGRQFAQKGAAADGNLVALPLAPADPVKVPQVPVPLAQKSVTVDPDLIKAAVREALHAESVPLEAATIKSFDPSPAIEAAVTKAVTPLLEKIQQQDTRLAETQRVIDAIADQPDPSTAAFSGLAFQPVRKMARPAGVTDIAEAAARARRATERELENMYNSSSDPHAREAYYATLTKMRGGATP